jgi:hypothetical protein
LEEEKRENDDGEQVYIRGVAVTNAWDVRTKHYNVATELEEIMAEFPNHRFSGELIREGDRSGDVERFRVGPGNAVTTEKARLVWPDGSEVTEVS